MITKMTHASQAGVSHTVAKDGRPAWGRFVRYEEPEWKKKSEAARVERDQVAEELANGDDVIEVG